MSERAGNGGSPGAASGIPGRLLSLYGSAWVAGAIPLFVVITALWRAFPAFGSTGTITIGAFALAYPVVVRRLGIPRRASFVSFLLVVGVVFGIVSVFTGWGNGLTDEPFTTPRFVSLLWNHQDPYVVPLVFNYVQYGQTIHSYSIYPYLPLLMFLQVPGLDYKWFALACWVGMVWLVRNRFDAGIFLAQPYFAVMAASGYNDFPVLLLLTVAFVGIAGKRQRWAQLLALGAKQFANVIVIFYYLVRRDWKNVLVTVGVSAAFILPFVVWSGPVVLCPTVLADRLHSCPNGGTAQYLLNYALWPAWVLAIFYTTLVREFRTSAEKGRLSPAVQRSGLSVSELLRVPSFLIVAATGALAAITLFLGLGVFLGDSVLVVTLSAAAGWAALSAWAVAMDSGATAPPTFLGRSVAPWRFHALVHLGALAVNVVVVLGVVLLGPSALLGEIVGASLAAAWESAVLFLAQTSWGTRAPGVGVRRGPDPKGA